MKKRVLSLALAVLMLLVALPVVTLPASATEEPAPTYEIADYNALYVQNGLGFGFDFFSTNEYWAGEGYSATLPKNDKTAAAAVLNSFVYKSANISVKFGFNDTTKEETVVIADGYLDMSGIYQLLVNQADAVMNDAYGAGSTVELVMTPGTTAKGGQFPVLNDHRYVGAISGDSFVFSAITLQNTELPLVKDLTYNGAPVGLKLGTLGTYAFTMRRPEDTQSFYNFSYSAAGVERPAGVDKDSSSNFHVGFAATYEGDTVVAITPVAVTSANTFSFYLSKPTIVEFEGKKYIVGKTSRAETLAGEGEPFLHDPTTDPGMLGIYFNGDTLYYNDAVAYHNNDKSSATYLRLWGSGPDSAMYAGRFYARVLTENEMAINHAVDLMKWFRLDITGYTSLGTNDRVTMAKALASYDLTSDPVAVAVALQDAYNSIAYDGLLDGLTEGTPAYVNTAAFLVVAKQYQLSISELKLLPEYEREEIYNVVTAVAATPIPHTRTELQDVLDEKFNDILSRYIGDQPEYDYKDIYVRQDKLKVALDFFDAKATDDPVLVGVTYNWLDLYNDYTANWQAKGFASKAAAIEKARLDRTETKTANTWDLMLSKYMWKGTNKDFTALDISDKNYPHDNIRPYGDGYLNCTLNNSIMLPLKDDDTDLTYQVVGQIQGGNWQVRGFRPNFGNSGGVLSVTALSYYGLTVSGTQDEPKFNVGGIPSVNIPKDSKGKSTITCSSVYSADFTAVVDKTPGGDTAHYYSYVWDDTLKTPAWVVTEVSDPADANYGPVVYTGKMNLKFYGNGDNIYELDKHYSPNANDSLGNSGSNKYYAIRLYTCTLTEAEIRQNHFADLAGLYDLDLAPYYRLTDAARTELHDLLRTVELGTPADLVEQYYHNVLNRVYYTLDTNSEASVTALNLAKEYLLDISPIIALSPKSRERVYSALASDPLVVEGVQWHPAILQSKVNKLVEEVQKEYFAESVSHRVIDLAGYQVNLTGENMGMRAIFEMDWALIEQLYLQQGIQLTLGVMLLPATADGAAVTVENGSIVLPSEALASVIAYDAGNVTSAVTPDYTYTLEYYPDADNVDTDVAFVGFTCIQVPGEEPIITYEEYTAGNITTGNAFSLLDLSRYVKRVQGLAHKNIQALLNAADDGEDVSIRLGNADLSDYVLYKTNDNHEAIEKVQALVYSYTGIYLRVAEVDTIADYEYVFYVGSFDTVYTEKALYGIHAYGNSFGLWYNDRANTDAAVDKLEDVFKLAAAAEDLSYHVTAGTAYTFRAR